MESFTPTANYESPALFCMVLVVGGSQRNRKESKKGILKNPSSCTIAWKLESLENSYVCLHLAPAAEIRGNRITAKPGSVSGESRNTLECREQKKEAGSR